MNDLDDNYIEEPIVEFCRINSSGPKTDPSLKIKVHLSSISTENISVKFNVTGSSDIEDFSYGEGILNIDAGLKFGIINIDDILKIDLVLSKAIEKLFYFNRIF